MSNFENTAPDDRHDDDVVEEQQIVDSPEPRDADRLLDEADEVEIDRFIAGLE